MGKSPGKWIKTLLFGKKSSRSHAPKTRAAAAKGKDWNGGTGEHALPVSSTVISEQFPTKTDANASDTEIEKRAQSDLASGVEVTLPWQEGVDKQGSSVSNVSTDPGRAREEQAAIKAQAAFRGYLARRAFRALKGIIRLQALIRGHLVRRQAVATLHCMWGIVKLQALVRGQSVRRGIHFEVKRASHLAKDVKHMGSLGGNVSLWKGKTAANAYVCKLFSSSTVVKPLDLQYNMEESNSVQSWLERWTSSVFWKPPPQPRKVLDLKPQGKHYAMETESGRSKRSVRKNFGANIDLGLNNVASESEKPKRNLKKVSSHPAEPVQENPQSELERVKRNLRKVSNSISEASDRVEVDMEKPKRSMQKVSNPSDNLDLCVDDTTEKMQKAVANLALETKSVETASKCNVQKVANSSETDQGERETAENVKQDVPLIPTISQSVETTSMPVLPVGEIDAVLESSPAVDPNTSQDTGKVERYAPVNGEYRSKEEEASHENQKSGKRRSSFSSKSEYTENGLQSTPKLPSYMAATESAKAKLRGQNSPRLGSDEVEKNGFTRRHSLPSSINGKLNSLSPRTQRLVQASGKGGLRSDRSLLSSRDGNDKPIHAEWRR